MRPALLLILAGLNPFPVFSLKQDGLMVLKMLSVGFSALFLLLRSTDIYKPSVVLELESVRLRLLLLRSIFNDVFFALLDLLLFRRRWLLVIRVFLSNKLLGGIINNTYLLSIFVKNSSIFV